MKKGITFTFTTQDEAHYYPVEYPNGLREEKGCYIIGDKYYQEKFLVESYEWYDICQKCGGIIEDGKCTVCRKKQKERDK